MNDQELIQQAQAGDRESFAELVRRHHQRVIGYCMSFLKDSVQAQDAAQDVFVKAYEAIGKFRGEAQFTTWIFTIAHRHCLDIFRSQKRRRAESWESMLEEHGDRLESLVRSGPGMAEQIENRDLVNRGLATLKEEYREVLVLREEQGLTYEEMARVLACSVDAIKARLKRARKDFLEKMRPLLGDAVVPGLGGQK